MKGPLIITAILLLSVICEAQDNKEDSLLINSLQQQLKGSTGITEVDILNDIAWEYMWYGSEKGPSYEYAEKAKMKAAALNYDRGLGYATFILAYQYIRSNKALADSMFNEALHIGEKINEPRLLGWYYYQQWDLKKAIVYFRQAKDIDGEAEAATWLCEEYSSRDETEKDFSYCQRALELAVVKKQRRLQYNKWMTGFAYTTLSALYNNAGDYESSLSFINKAKPYSSERDVNWSYASTYWEMGKYDSSVYYYEKALLDARNRWHVMRYVGYANQKAGNFKRAIDLLEESSKMFQKAEDEKQGTTAFNWRGEIHSHLGEAYDSIGNRKKALQNYRFALEHLRKSYQLLQLTPKPGSKFYGYDRDRKNWIMKVSGELYTIFSGLKKYDSALFYYKQFAEMKDTLDSKKRAWQLNMQLSNLKKAAEEQKRIGQLKLLEKDNQLSQAKLKEEIFMKKSLAAGLILLLVLSLITFRTLHFKRKSEKLRRLQLENEMTLAELESKQKQSALQQKATELEMQALRAQMNPHFIFNCLSSINRFVLKNETEAASDYLTRFSRLIRMVLINSQKSTITLEDEIEMLRLYLDMERLRFKNSFDYNITYSNSVDAGAIMIPPLLLQPFCENAIWHGLMHKEGHGSLNIIIAMDRNVLQCTIADDGIGRKKAAELKSKSGEKEKSLGLKITTDRLALINETNDIQTFYEMHDLTDKNGEAAGTKADIKIRYKEEITEHV
jgi:tetratricopeptide (TPR) repeat protein